METLWQDLRFGFRILRSKPGFAAVAALVLALGTGANTAVFSAVNALLLRPLPVRDADRLVFGMALREGYDPFGTSLLEYDLYAREARSLAESGVGTPRLFTLVGSPEPERLRGAAVTASYLETLGVEPVLGRLFTAEEDRPGGPAVALLGHGLWRRRFAADSGVVGRVLKLEEGPHVVVGVLPPGFDVPYSAEAWVPMQARGALPLDQRAAAANEFVARLAPGVSLARADAELKRLALRLEQDYPQIRRGWSFGVVPLRRQLMGDLEGRTRRSLLAMVVAVACLLLVCCANVASLLLARGMAREGEMAIRISLGAGRARLVRQLLAESLLLALLGGGLGVAIAFSLRPLLAALSPVQAVGLGSTLTDFRLDGRVLAFSLLISLLTGAVFGTVAALRAIRSGDLVASLKARSQHSGGADTGRRPLGALVVGEIAVAATLLVGGAIVTKSFLHLREIDLGFRPDRVLMMELPLSPVRYEGQERRVRLVEDVLQRVRSLPGVVGAGFTTNVPLQRGVQLDSVFDVEGHPRTNPADVPITSHRLVSPGYLETMGVTVESGRLLDEGDRDGSPLVAVVTRELARQGWPGRDPLGKRIRRLRAGQAGPWMTVVGVVKDVREDRFGFRTARPVWYLPYAQQTAPLPLSLPLNLVVRTGGDPTSIAAAVREAIRAVDPGLPVTGVAPMSGHLSDVLLAERFAAALMGTLAGLGLALSALGLYGVMAYSVSQRRREIGLRMALGARPRDVLRLVLGEGGRLVGLGLVLGLLGSFGLGRLLASTLPEVGPADPHILLLVALVLGSAALVACWLPAREAARVDPMAALRSE